MKKALAGAAFALCACAPNASPAAVPSYRLIDLSDDYAALYDRTLAMTAAERVAAFHEEIGPLFPEFYGNDRYVAQDTERYDARIARSFERFADIRTDYERAEASFVSMLGSALGTFSRAFPDMGPIGDIYLLHSLGEMDGGTREFGGRSYFVFGVDVIAQVHPPGTERPFFHHELFHVYQGQFFTADCEEIWCLLWMEGAAVLAAEELNPGATDEQLLLSRPTPIRASVDENLTEAACVARARLDSREDADSEALFGPRRLNEHLPPRFGYYVGYLVAREARRARTLQQIAHMSAAEARAAVDAGLAALAACPGRTE
jgi:hypothetical protein